MGKFSATSMKDSPVRIPLNAPRHPFSWVRGQTLPEEMCVFYKSFHKRYGETDRGRLGREGGLCSEVKMDGERRVREDSQEMRYLGVGLLVEATISFQGPQTSPLQVYY